MTKAVAKMTVSDLPAEIHNTSWGTENVDFSDALVPKLLLMQGLSKLVTSDNAQMGDYVNSVSGEILGTAREKDLKPVKIIPLTFDQTWVEHVLGGDGKRRYVRTIPRNSINANLPNEGPGAGEWEGQMISRDRALIFYVRVAEDTGALPYTMIFKRTSFRTGQTLVSHFANCKEANKPPASTTFSLSGKKVTNDSGTFYVMDVSMHGPTSAEDLKLAYACYQRLKATKVLQVDDSDLKAEAETSGAKDVAEDRF